MKRKKKNLIKILIKTQINRKKYKRNIYNNQYKSLMNNSHNPKKFF